MASFGILSLAPPIIALVLAFVTRDALISIMTGVVVGCFILDGNPLFNFTGTIIGGCGNKDFMWVLLIEIFIGIMVAFFQKSGAIQELSFRLGGNKGISARLAQMLSTLLGIFVFFSDYFSPLFTGNVARGITDKARVSREKLAYICDCTSAPVCITIPFTSWAVYVAGLLIGIGAIADVDMAQTAIIKAVPFQFYGIVSLIFVLAISSGIIPDFGPMKAAEKRAAEEGKVYADGSNPLLSKELDSIQPTDGIRTNLFIHFFMPALLIIFITMGTYIVMGSAKTLEAFVIAVLFQGVILLAYKMVDLKELMECVNIGVRSVTAACLILGAAYSINSISKQLGTAQYVIDITEAWMTPVTLLAFTFAICAFISFFTGTSWGTYAIMVPICMPLAFNVTGGVVDSLIYATVAAIMGGGCFGDHCSPLSDTTILSSLGAGSDHVDHVRTQIPYALVSATISLLLYIVVGFALS